MRIKLITAVSTKHKKYLLCIYVGVQRNDQVEIIKKTHKRLIFFAFPLVDKLHTTYNSFNVSFRLPFLGLLKNLPLTYICSLKYFLNSRFTTYIFKL